MGFVLFQKNTKPVFQRPWVNRWGSGRGLPIVHCKWLLYAAYLLFRIILDSDWFRALAGEGLDSPIAKAGWLCVAAPREQGEGCACARQWVPTYSHPVTLAKQLVKDAGWHSTHTKFPSLACCLLMREIFLGMT